MLTTVLAILIVFYLGAVGVTGRSWLAVRRGAIGFSALRDLTGISDRVTLYRLFGPTRPDGQYTVTWKAVLRHRRRAGALLADLPVHALFLLALIWATFNGALPTANGIACAALLHGLVLGGAALTILVRDGRPLAD